jgi:hypothetical protein
MSPGARAPLAWGVALALGALAATFALRYGGRGGAQVAPCFPSEQVPAARALLARLLDGLAGLQDPDGGFALDAPEDRPSTPEPDVKRTAAAALATWALGEGVRLGVASELARGAFERAQALVSGRQGADGSLGRMPPTGLGAVDRGPEVTALAGAVLAFAPSDAPAHGLVVGRALRALAPVLGGGLRDGWQRAVVAMAIDAADRAGRAGGLGREPRLALALGETRALPDCGDYRLAEAMVRVVRREPAHGDLYPEAVLRACLTEEPLRWSGQTSDVKSWLLQAWLARHSRQAGAWFAAALEPLEAGVGPDGVVPGGIYADRVTQTAAAALVIAHGLRSQVLD